MVMIPFGSFEALVEEGIEHRHGSGFRIPNFTTEIKDLITSAERCNRFFGCDVTRKKKKE